MPKDPMLLEIRDRLVDRVDRRLAVILSGSLAFHVAIASFAWAHDVELPARPYAVPSLLYQQDMIDVTLPDPPKLAAEPGPGISVSKGTKAPSRSIVRQAPVNAQSLA